MFDNKSNIKKIEGQNSEKSHNIQNRMLLSMINIKRLKDLKNKTLKDLKNSVLGRNKRKYSFGDIPFGKKLFMLGFDRLLSSEFFLYTDLKSLKPIIIEMNIALKLFFRKDTINQNKQK